MHVHVELNKIIMIIILHSDSQYHTYGDTVTDNRSHYHYDHNHCGYHNVNVIINIMIILIISIGLGV